MSDGTENTPPPEVTAVNVSLVPLFLAATSAPGTAPPPESTTTPEMDAIEEPWAKAVTLVRHARSIVPATPIGRCLIASLLENLELRTYTLELRTSGLFFANRGEKRRVLNLD